MRRRKAKTLIILGGFWMIPALVTSTEGGFWMESMQAEVAVIEARAESGEELNEEETETLASWEEMRVFVAPSVEDLEADVEAYLGSYGNIVAHRAPGVMMAQIMGLPFSMLWRIGGLMLIGMGLMKLGVFAARKDVRFYRRLALWGYGLGLPLVAISAWQLATHDWNFIFSMKVGMHWNYVGSVLVSLGHISVVMLAVKGNWLGSFQRRFAAVGRMAFTNYLLPSILCTTFFYGYGFGLYGSLNRPIQMIIVLPVWTGQLSYSKWWLDRFNYGPAEWFWRLLTYGKIPEFRRVIA